MDLRARLQAFFLEMAQREGEALQVLCQLLTCWKGLLLLIASVSIQWLWAYLILASNRCNGVIDKLLSASEGAQWRVFLEWEYILLVVLLLLPTALARLFLFRRFPLHMTFLTVLGPGIVLLAAVRMHA